MSSLRSRTARFGSPSVSIGSSGSGCCLDASQASVIADGIIMMLDRPSTRMDAHYIPADIERCIPYTILPP